MLLLEIGLVARLTRRPAIPNLAERAPKPRVAPARDSVALDLRSVPAGGRTSHRAALFRGRHGAALKWVAGRRDPRAAEVITWAAFNGIFLALIPHGVFRWRGCSHGQLNLKSDNWKNDLLVIVVVLAIGIGLDLTAPNIFQLTRHQQLMGGILSFVLHMAGTDLPITIFIYSILLPHYARLCSPMTAFLRGAASYPTRHGFESWAVTTRFRAGSCRSFWCIWFSSRRD